MTAITTPGRPESWRTRFMRWGFNFFPAFRGTGGRVIFIADDWREVRIRIPLNWRTRNYVGTIFGGSMYAAIDPFYMFMLIRILGPTYVVWDKAASIRFRKPGRETLFASFSLTDDDIEGIRRDVARDGKTERDYLVELVGADGTLHATCHKKVSIRQR